MRTSNPPSYDQLKTLYISGATLMADGSSLTNYVVPSHRGLLLVNSSTTAMITDKITATNIDGTTSNIQVSPGTTLLPLQVWKLTVSSGTTGLYIYSLR